MKEIYPRGVNGKGLVILVSDSEFGWLSNRRWHITGLRTNRPSETPRPYAYTSIAGKPYLMHRLLTDAQVGMSIDHIDGNSLNNCLENLRIATQSQNIGNSVGRPHSSVFKGVFRWERGRKLQPWCARIKVNGKSYHLGMFASEEEAARAYDAAARLHFGQFARPNFA